VATKVPERRANLRNAEITHPPIEACAVDSVAVMNEKARRPSIPSAVFHDLLCCPCGSRVRRYTDVDDLPVRVVDHEENVQLPEKKPFARRRNRTPRWRRRAVSGKAASSVMGFDEWSMHVLGNCSSRNFVPKPGKLRLDPALTPKTVVDGHAPDQSP
jgi:hypothetical protein